MNAVTDMVENVTFMHLTPERRVKLDVPLQVRFRPRYAPRCSPQCPPPSAAERREPCAVSRGVRSSGILP